MRWVSKLQSGFSKRSPSNTTRSACASSVKGDGNVLRQIHGIWNFNPSATVREIAHDTIKYRGRTKDDFGALEHPHAKIFAIFRHRELQSIQIKYKANIGSALN
jgi:hypothetical protein